MKSNLKIVVVAAGHVFIGEVEGCSSFLNMGDTGIYIRNCRNIRRWGTQRGLGQLALEGPTSETILDDVGMIHVPNHSIIYTIACDDSKWESK